jgi:molybdopterin-guanine dinucleotide biosynthesis protein A
VTDGARAAALLLADPLPAPPAPPGIDPARFALAMWEDVADLLSQLAGVDAIIAHTAARRDDAVAISWPGTILLEVDHHAGPIDALAAMARRGYGVGAVVAADAPDLPGLVIAKPFSALSSALAAVAPSDNGGAVVLAGRLPLPDWLTAAGGNLDDDDLSERLQQAAPRRRDVRITPAWHRLRSPADVGRLDPGLEGWEATRALLEGS